MYQKTIFIFLSLIVSSFAFGQSAWTQKKGEAFTQFSYNFIGDYEKLFTDQGSDFETGRTISESTIQAYGEYGVSDDLTLVLNLPVVSISTNEENPDSTVTPVTITEDTVTNLGNVVIGGRYKFYDKAFTLSGQLDIEANTSSGDEASGLRTGLDAWSFIPTINLGFGFNKMYFQLSTGVAIRTNDYSNSFKLKAEYGYKVLQKLWVIGFVDALQSFKNGDASVSIESAQTGLFVNDQEYVATGIKALYEFNDESGVTFAYAGAASGTAVPKSAAISLGYFIKF